MLTSEKKKRLERQYELAIDARDKLNDSFHKWMTYYYVANGAILVAITTLSNKKETDKGIFVLSLVGLLVCVLWNLSCKGYYYWSKSWIEIIIRLERGLIEDDFSIGVYSVFSKEVAEKEDTPWKVFGSANISTPKLTMLFSFCSILSWTAFSVWGFHLIYPLTNCANILIVVFSLMFISLLYYGLLPRFAKSRIGPSHVLI